MNDGVIIEIDPMSPSLPRILEVQGTPPDIVGRVCEGFVCEGYVCDGEPVGSANVTYVRFGGTWFRLCVDVPVIFWGRVDEDPAPWAIASESWAYPHTDVGALAGIVGQPVMSFEMLPTREGVRIAFRFADGRCVVLEDREDVTSYAVLPPTIRPET